VDGLLVSRDEEFALVTLNRPEVMNALSSEILASLPRVVEALEQENPCPRALFFLGAGERAFCAGADVGGLGTKTVTGQIQRVESAQKALGHISSSSLPSMALIHGHALGGGLELALACDFRIATPEARFSLPEVKLGLVPSFGGTQRLPRLIGETHALDMIMTGRSIDAEEALAIGLISMIAPREELLDNAKAFARRFTAHSLPVLSLIRQAVTRGGELPMEEALALEAQCSALAHQTADAKEGLAAFREKRKAQFKDR